MRFRETKVTKEKCYAAKKPMKIWNVNVDNKYLIGYFYKAI